MDELDALLAKKRTLFRHCILDGARSEIHDGLEPFRSQRREGRGRILTRGDQLLAAMGTTFAAVSAATAAQQQVMAAATGARTVFMCAGQASPAVA